MFERKSMESLGRKSPDEMKVSEKLPIILVLDGVRSMHNVGSAFRTADSFGVEAIYLCGFTPTPPHRDIRKTALGAEDTVHWKHFSTISDALNDLRDKNYNIISIEQAHNSTELQSFAWDKLPTALIFGNEVDGVSDDALAASSACVEIPQSGTKHSLNISVSVGVVLWELVRKTFG